MNNIEQMKQTVSKAIDDMYQEGGSNVVGYITTALHKAGYRKQSETVKEFAEKIKAKIAEIIDKPNIGETEEEYESIEDFKSGMNEAIEIINELAEQYGKEE